MPWDAEIPKPIHGVAIAHRTMQSADEILRMAGDRLHEYMNALEIVDQGTIALINEIDRLRRDLY